MKGSCLCGQIRFRTEGPPLRTSFCHCSQCRKQSGHYWASASFPGPAVRIEGDVAWYRASPAARRGFCATCGAFLFWQGEGSGETAVALGAVDGKTGLTVTRHIFTDDRGDYYEIPSQAGTHA